MASDSYDAEALAFAAEIIGGLNLDEQLPSLRDFSRRLKLPGGKLKGHFYDPNSDPVQSYLLDQMDSGRWKRIYATASPQIAGKTQVLILTPALRAIIAGKQSVGYGLPTLDDLNKAWSEKLKDSIEKSGYEKYLPSKGPGARGGRGPSLTMQDPETGSPLGRLVFMAGTARQVTCSVVLVDEVDLLRTADGTPRWEDLEDMFHRADAFGPDALRIAVGTIESDTHSMVLVLAGEHGTGTRPWLKCPHCGRHQLVTWDQVRYDPSDDKAAAESARISCQHCPAQWTEDDRQDAITGAVFVHKTQTADQDGTVVGPEPRTEALGMIWSALDCTLADLGELVIEHRLALEDIEKRGSHGLMRKFHRYRLCKTYEGDLIDDDDAPAMVTRSWLARRSAASEMAELEDYTEQDGDSWHIGTPPEGTEFITVGTDVQRGGARAPGRLYWSAIGHGQNPCSCAWGTVVASPKGREPTAVELHEALDRLDELLDQLEGRWGIPIKRRGLDVGDRQDELRLWLDRQPATRWVAIKGDGQNLKVQHKYQPTKRGNQRQKPVQWRDLPQVAYHRYQLEPGGKRWWLCHVDSHHIRADIQRRLLQDPDDAGSWLIPPGLPARATLIRHLCSQVLIRDARNILRWSERRDRLMHPEWQQRDDYLDCHIYGYALGLLAEQEGVPAPEHPISGQEMPDADEATRAWVESTATDWITGGSTGAW